VIIDNSDKHRSEENSCEDTDEETVVPDHKEKKKPRIKKLPPPKPLTVEGEEKPKRVNYRPSEHGGLTKGGEIDKRIKNKDSLKKA
jgi:hypothetical protein